ncbi:unnamed protein product [Chironomus riparius]|uniref:Enkurin domain-containing protein n=1 Tax=Chironomus riparius TaxID=315576 RepID=A0A9N9RM33_9DIPT|nr:unnamed protein product [Chironomus riparius]
MESLRGIFPRTEPPAKRDFLKENVMRIRNIQRMRKPKDTEYSNKFNKPQKTRKLSLYEDRMPTPSRSSNSLTLCSTKAPIGNLRKSLSTMSISKDCGTQTVDPEADEYFLKDTIIRYPSASTIRSVGTSQQQLSHTCSKGHLLEQEAAPRYKSHFHDRKDDHSEKMDRHVKNLSEFLDKGSITKKQPSSILKSSSSLQKLNKNSLNEYQRREDRTQRVGSAHHSRETVLISDESGSEKDEEIIEITNLDKNKKELPKNKKKKELGNGDIVDAKKKQLEAAKDDPDCPDGHVPLSEDERLESLRIAKKRFKELVDELNRLPMTCETLRVRNRKIEIEKELRSLEINIRVFSRSKVYVKLTE